MAAKHDNAAPIQTWKSFKVRSDLHQMAAAICAWRGGVEMTTYFNDLIAQGIAADYKEMLAAYAKELEGAKPRK